jgi:hypothetical protein
MQHFHVLLKAVIQIFSTPYYWDQKLNSIIFKFQYYLRQYMFVALNNGSSDKEILLELLFSQLKITQTAVGN